MTFTYTEEMAGPGLEKAVQLTYSDSNPPLKTSVLPNSTESNTCEASMASHSCHLKTWEGLSSIQGQAALHGIYTPTWATWEPASKLKTKNQNK